MRSLDEQLSFELREAQNTTVCEKFGGAMEMIRADHVDAVAFEMSPPRTFRSREIHVQLTCSQTIVFCGFLQLSRTKIAQPSDCSDRY